MSAAKKASSRARPKPKSRPKATKPVRKAKPRAAASKAAKAKKSPARAAKARKAPQAAKARPKRAARPARKAASKPARATSKATKATKAARAATKKATKARRPAARPKPSSRPKPKPSPRPRPAARAAARPLPDAPPPARTYMSSRQCEWFKRKLEQMLLEIQHEAKETAQEMREKEKGLADELDRAHNEFTFVVDLRENDRIFNLQDKINHVLRLIDNGTYGICDDCGVEIGIDRMVARPVATKCIDCKQFQEEMERNAK